MTAEVVRGGVQERLDRLGVDQRRSAAVPLVDLRASGLARRPARDGAAARGRADRRDRRHQFRRRASGAWRWPTASRSPPTRSRSRWSTAAPPATLSELCARTRRQAARLWHALRRLPVGALARQARADEIADWSRSKYKRFIDAAGGWDAVPGHSARRRRDRAASTASRSPTSPPAGCSSTRRWPRPSSARGIGESEHRDDNLKRLQLRARRRGPRARSTRPLPATQPIPGDCGDEYRRPPFLTASGDLSHHLDAMPVGLQGRAGARPAGPAARLLGQHLGADRRLQPRGAGQATRSAFPAPPRRTAPTAASRPATPARRPPTSSTRSPPRIAALGGRIEDVSAPASISATPAQWEPVSRAHGRVFGDILPGQHADRGRRPDRRLRGRDRGRSRRRGLTGLNGPRRRGRPQSVGEADRRCGCATGVRRSRTTGYVTVCYVPDSVPASAPDVAHWRQVTSDSESIVENKERAGRAAAARPSRFPDAGRPNSGGRVGRARARRTALADRAR